MREVLAGKEFRDLQEQSVRDSVLEKFGQWLNHLFASADFLRRAPPGLAARWYGDSFWAFASRWSIRCCGLSAAGALAHAR